MWSGLRSLCLHQLINAPGFFCLEAGLTQRNALAMLPGTWALLQVAMGSAQHGLSKPYIKVFLGSLGQRATSNTGALGTSLIFGALIQLSAERNKDPSSSLEGSVDVQWIRRCESTLQTEESYSLLECAYQYGALLFCLGFSSRSPRDTGED